MTGLLPPLLGRASTYRRSEGSDDAIQGEHGGEVEISRRLLRSLPHGSVALSRSVSRSCSRRARTFEEKRRERAEYRKGKD